MKAALREFWNLIEGNIHFEHQMGESTLVGFPHTTGWRTLPVLVVAQLNYTATLELEEDKPLRINPGETITLVPDRAHCLSKVTRQPAYSHWSHIQCEVFAGVSLFYLAEPPLVISGSQSRKIGRINHDLGEISKAEHSMASLLRRQALGWELILTLLQSVSLKDDRIELIRQVSRLAPVLAYIEKNLATPISHDLLAQKASLSPSRFHFLFRSAMGSAPYEYVQKVRLKKARQLLLHTDSPVAQIGREVGHPDPYHFSRMFKRNVGVSPARYRQGMIPHSF